MSSWLKATVTLVLCLAACVAVPCQTSLNQILQPSTTVAGKPGSAAVDSYGRGTLQGLCWDSSRRLRREITASLPSTSR